VKVALVETAPEDIAADAIAVPLAGASGAGRAQGSFGLTGPAQALDGTLGGLLAELIAGGEFKGRLHVIFTVPTQGRIAPRRVILYGLGAAEDLDGQRLRAAHHEMVRAARRLGYKRLAVLRSDPVTPDSLQAVVEGCVMGDFERRSRQTGATPERGEIDELVLIGFGAGRESEVAAAQQAGEATNHARELQNTPANELTPDALAQEATRIAERRGLELEILGPAELRAGGYNLLRGVAAGSAQPPRLIRLRHRGGRPPSDTSPPDARVLALIGKGVTFDTGGISLKDPKGMEYMKADMAGAAAVLAAIDVIAARSLPLDVMAVVAATENMPGPTAQRPGDVVVSANGKTVEVINTDAEGRLILADAVTYALRSGATHLVDLATLTGAATIAIGHAATAVVCNDDGLWKLVDEAGRKAGDRVWRLPIYADYQVLLKSQVADIRNSDYGEAGTVLGGMFIGEFVDGKPWAHLDIAASSWNRNAELTTVVRGPSGAGTRLCVELAELMAAAER
jgi:leucyl aminopeptidase